jgi:hypothetical protein
MASCGECLVDVVGDTVSGAGDVDPGVRPCGRLNQVKSRDQDAVDVVVPLDGADLAAVDSVVDRFSERYECQPVDDRGFLFAVKVGADHPVEVVGVRGCEAVGVSLAGGVSALVTSAGASGEHFTQSAAPFEAGCETRLTKQGCEVCQQIVAGFWGHPSMGGTQSARQPNEQKDVWIHVRPSGHGHVEQREHDSVGTVLVREVAQRSDESADTADSLERRPVRGPVARERVLGEGLLECSELGTEVHGCLLGVSLSEAMVRFGVPGDVPGRVPDSVPDQGFPFPIGAL